MEILLLDTTEKEGDDNMLFHYSQQATLPSLRQDEPVWLSLRGVLAAAMGATTSFCGEPLQTAHFRVGGDLERVVGFANLYEVLYILVFPKSVPSIEIVQVSHYDTFMSDAESKLTPYILSLVLYAVELRSVAQRLWIS